MLNRRALLRVVRGIIVVGIVGWLAFALVQKYAWRIDAAWTYFRRLLRPVGSVPTAISIPSTSSPMVSPEVITHTTDSPPTPTEVAATPTPEATPTPLPASVSLMAPSWEKQDWNNCGPATLSMYLRTFGWEGDQFDISQLLKPERADRNVNVEELVYFVRTRVGWLRVVYRVGGTVTLLKSLLAAGLPVMIEEGFYLEESYWPNDDRWAAHYLLLTGYEDAEKSFTAQDSFIGPDQQLPYQVLDANWKVFNRVFIIVYHPSQEDIVRSVLGEEWDPQVNRQHALEAARDEIGRDAKDAFAWFNLGTNLVYFERYKEAAQAYDAARSIGLPQRMLRYQFGPFLAYFHSGRLEDLLALTEYALQITRNSEEALLWRGWARYRQGDIPEAIEDFRVALQANPNYRDARYALDFLGVGGE